MLRKISLNLMPLHNRASRNLKFFLGSFFLSLPIFWTLNIFQKNFEDFLFRSQMAKNPQVLVAQIAKEDKSIVKQPVRNWRVDILKLEAKSAISVLVDSKGTEGILFESGNNEKLPIASLTKLMTADIVWENYDLSELIEISSKAVKEEGDSGNFRIGESFTVRNLLYPLLIESSNDAAEALTEVIGKEAFVELMNLQAKSLDLQNTQFFNSTGLEPDKPDGPINYSTSRDLTKLAAYLLKTNPKILEISSLPEYDLYLPDGIFHHKLLNTNELLKELSDVMGSKTGWTPQAQGCLILLMKAPNNNDVIINVILGSPNRFEEMKKLINWVGEAYNGW